MSEITNAIKQICEEKNLSYEAVISTIESALAAAYRKDFGKKNQNIKVVFDPETSKSKVYDVKTVVADLPATDEELPAENKENQVLAKEKKNKRTKKTEGLNKEEKLHLENQNNAPAFTEEAAKKKEEKGEEKEEERRFNPKTEIQLSDAKLIKKTAKIGDEIKIKLEVPDEYGRMAAQTAKQVIIQRLREAEREMIFNEFKSKEHEVVSGIVQRREGRVVLVDLGKAVGILPFEEQIPDEKYRPGERIKVFIKEVSLKTRGAEIILSRTAEEILKKVFYLEIPEISNGLIDIKAVAREAGHRSKVAVWTDSENVDPIGSCVGQRGARIQTIINELGGEKIDIIMFSEDQKRFIINALSPAKITNIELDETEKRAVVTVAPDQLSLAIGKGGQNARLAAKLTGWKIDIIEVQQEKKGEKEVKETDETKDEEKAETAELIKSNEGEDKKVAESERNKN